MIRDRPFTISASGWESSDFFSERYLCFRRHPPKDIKYYGSFQHETFENSFIIPVFLNENRLIVQLFLNALVSQYFKTVVEISFPNMNVNFELKILLIYQHAE